MNIRTATITDTKALQLLSLHLGYSDTSETVAEQRLQCLLESSNDEVWVFEESNRLLGWIHVFKANRVASAAFNEIGGLVVDPDSRNKGIGRKLVEFACRHSIALDLELRVRCHSKRQEAHRFYEKMGFSHSKSQYVFDIDCTKE